MMMMMILVGDNTTYTQNLFVLFHKGKLHQTEENICEKKNDTEDIFIPFQF